jgi:N-acyl-D-amino-acid deacylase
MNKKYLLKNATIYDGTGSNPFNGNVLIDDGKIVEVGNIDNVDAEIIDINGKALAPGFIDMHSHDDVAMFVYPDMDFKLMQGVTTNVNGNCGSGVIPHSAADIVNWYPNLEGIPEWSSYGEYSELVNKSKTSVHSAFLVGHGPIRKATTGNEERMPTKSEFDTMKAWIKEGMEEGAVGMSTGLIYEPGRYSNTEELIELTKTISPYNGVYFSHMRNEAGNLIQSVEETIKIGEEAGCSIEISHHKVSGQENWGKSVESLNTIDEARSRGLNVHSDQYPYNAGSTSLFALVQNNAFTTGDGGMGSQTGDKVTIAGSNVDPSLVGKTLGDLCDEFDLPEQEAAQKILKTDPGIFIVTEGMVEDDIARILAHPTTMIGSDGVPLPGNPHPRLYGCFPRVLGKYSREDGVISMEEAIHKMTGLSAEKANLNDRGLIKPGLNADIVIFDEDTIIDKATYDNPRVYPEGIIHVFVDGELSVKNGKQTEVRAGKVARRS